MTRYHCGVTDRARSTTMVGVGGPRIVVVPRWGGTPDDDWYPWARRELAGITVELLAMPEPASPTIEAWTATVLEALGDDPYALAQTMLVGHSVGAQAAMRAVARLGDGRAVAKLVAVAGWFAIDAPWPAIQPWIDTPIDPVQVRAGAHEIHVLLSTNDPFSRDYEANAAVWRDQLEAHVEVVAGAGHFNAATEPVVLAHLRQLFAQL
jgi:predicted alpha/beta hydrolase family esterase